VVLKLKPLRFGKLHSPPVIAPRGILATEFDPPRLSRRTFRRRDVRLEFDRVGASVGDSVNEGMCHTQTTIMRLRNLTDYKTGVTASY
jgi:hypothetical protein